MGKQQPNNDNRKVFHGIEYKFQLKIKINLKNKNKNKLFFMPAEVVLRPAIASQSQPELACKPAKINSNT